MSKKASQDSSRELDQFYTNPSYAQQFWHCVCNTVTVGEFDLVLEPSAGTGSFYDLLPPDRRTGIDLDPQAPGITQCDFFDWQPPQDSRVLVVGNPPFGKNANTAVKFFNRAAEFADAIAFVLPRTFRKPSVIDRLHDRFHCVHDELVPDNSFEWQGQPYDVWCCAQIWERRSQRRPKRERLKLADFRELFEIVPPYEADFAIQRVGGRAGLIRTQDFARYSDQSHYFVKQHDPRVLECFQACDWDRVKYNTVGNPSISPGELCELWQEQALKRQIPLTFGNGLFETGVDS